MTRASAKREEAALLSFEMKLERDAAGRIVGGAFQIGYGGGGCSVGAADTTQISVSRA